jgi:hypothetical protein
MLLAMPWTFSRRFFVPLDVRFTISTVSDVLLVATAIFQANRLASPAPQGRAILLLEAHLSLHALRVPLEPTLFLANEAAATAPRARTALIQPSVRRFVPQALTALPRAALLHIVNQEPSVLPANRFAPPAPQGRAILLLEAHLSLHALRVPLEPTLVLANEAAATAPQARTALINAEVL